MTFIISLPMYSLLPDVYVRHLGGMSYTSTSTIDFPSSSAPGNPGCLVPNPIYIYREGGREWWEGGL